MNAEQTNFALLGALIAVALVLLAVVGVGGYLALRGVGYFARFKSFQAARNGGAMSFGGVVDETPKPAPRLESEPIASVLDGKLEVKIKQQPEASN